MSSKITALTALTSTQTDDVLPIVDVHDTTMAASGTTKQITVANLQTGLAPLASPTLTGTPTAPTATALTSTTQLATTAYADAATGVEKARALAAEALLAPLASPGLTGTPTAPTKTALTNSTALATTAYADAAVSTEATRATTAEALALPKTGGTMSGAIAMGTSKITGVGNGSGPQDAAAFGQIPVVEGTVGNIKALGTAAALGSSGKWANSDHVHAWGQAAPASFTPADPTATASTTLVMMGLGATCTYTPTGSGLVLVVVTGGATTLTTQVPGILGGRFGTGTAPVNGAGPGGTRFGSAADVQFKSNGLPITVQTFALTAILTLTPGTAYWFDIALNTSNAADSAELKGMSMSFVELP